MPPGNKNRAAFVIFNAPLFRNLYKFIIATAVAGT